MAIRAGSSYHSEGGQLIKVKKVIQHPKYNPKLTDYDVSILILEKPLTYLFKVHPIELSKESADDYTGKNAIVSGWGFKHEGEGPSYQLQKLEVPVLPHSTCERLYKNLFTDRMMCAGFVKGGHDSCQVCI